MNKKILILTESGDKIGFGHFMRCSAIQDFLTDLDISTKMILNHFGKNHLKVQGEISDWLKNEDVLFENAKEYKTVLVDSYLAKEEDFVRLNNFFSKVVVVDDYNRINYKVDLIINPNVFIGDLDYSNQDINKIEGGENFVILRKVFRQENTSSISKIIKHLCITVGGSDYRNLLPDLITVISSQFPQATLAVLSGNDTLKQELENNFNRVQLFGFLSAKQMYEAFAKTDLVISACGQTLHELASMGRPTIGICIDIDQELNQKYYYDKGFLRSKIDYKSMHLIQDQLIEYQNVEVRRELSRIGPSLINKDGIENIGELLINY